MPAVTGDEQLLQDYWFNQTLISDTTFATMVGRQIANTLAPAKSAGAPGFTYPYCVFQCLNPGPDVPVLGFPGRIMTNSTYSAKIVAAFPATFSKVKPIVDRLDFLLEKLNDVMTYSDTNGSTTFNVSCHRTTPVFAAENNLGEIVYHYGGIYAVEFQICE